MLDERTSALWEAPLFDQCNVLHFTFTFKNVNIQFGWLSISTKSGGNYF